MPRKKIDAVAYCRTSSASNVGAEKDSLPRQNEAIQGYAKKAGFVIVEQFDDPAVSGEDVIETRPGFSALMDRIEGNGVSTVLVEDESGEPYSNGKRYRKFYVPVGMLEPVDE